MLFRSLGQLVPVFVKGPPGIPLGADEPARDAVAVRAGEIDGKGRAEIGRGGALFLPLLVLLEEGCADFIRAGGENFIDKPGGERTGATDPRSGTAEFKASAIRVERLAVDAVVGD